MVPEKHTVSAFHSSTFSTSYIFFLSREISADCYAKQFCVSVWLGRQLLFLMRSASITVFPWIETHGGSRMFQIRQWCALRRYHAVSWKWMLRCSHDKINEFCWSLAESEAFPVSGCSSAASPWDPWSKGAFKTTASLPVYFLLMSYNTCQDCDILKT